MKMTHSISQEKEKEEVEKYARRVRGSEYPIITLGTSQENTNNRILSQHLEILFNLVTDQNRRTE
jgi:hypothetical protein